MAGMSPVATALEARFDRELPAEPENVGELRRALSDFARRHGADDATVIDLALAVSEAATNVVLHAFVGLQPGRMRVIAEPRDGQLEVWVRDDGRGMVPRPDSPGIGLGLPTIGQLTSRFDVQDGPGGVGTEVRMLFDAPGIHTPPELDWRADVLAGIAQLAGSAWPAEGVDRLVGILVPRVADACTLDLVEAGAARRVAAGADGADGASPTLSAWLLGRRPKDDVVRASLPALAEGRVVVTLLDDATNQGLAGDSADLERMRELELRWWVSVPLLAGGALLGTIGLGLRASRTDPAEDEAFLTALGERAARGLGGGHLVDELRRTRRRLERILAVLSEAVTVHDVEGRIVYANEAAARLLGAASVDEVLEAEPGSLTARFDIFDEHGARISDDALPGARLVAGEPTPSLLTRSVHRATGREHWLLTKASRLDDDPEGMLVVNVIDDVTDVKLAERRLAERRDD